MKRCKYCGDSCVPEGEDQCYDCFALRKLIDKNVARARSVYDRKLLKAALRDNRLSYLAILHDMEKTNE